jgi:serine/threonine-protein kinase
MGIVYKATDEKLRRTVALKVLPEEYTKDQERRTRFLREARSAAAVTDAHIATIYEVGEDAGRVFIAMELVDGQSLRQKLEAGAFTPAETLRIAKQITKALAKAHDKGVVHRDLKPDNVMLTSDGDVKILDFGLAKLREEAAAASTDSVLEKQDTESHVTQEGRILGTPGYMSPEQATGKVVDARSDIFSLGVLLYEMLTGRPAFGRGSPMDVIIRASRDEPEPLREHAPETPEELRAIVERCMRKAPADRFGSARELAAALQGSTGEEPARSADRSPSLPSPSAPAVPASRPAMSSTGATARTVDDRPRRRWRRLAIGVTLLVALGGANRLKRALRVGEQPDAPMATASAAFAAPSTKPTAVTAVAQPVSSSAEALAHYAAGLRMIREGDWTNSRAEFELARKLDPTMTSASLRLAIESAISYRDPNTTRDLYVQAIAGRDRLGERDRGLLDALQPILQRSPWDRRECAKRLRALGEKYPGDAEIQVLRAWMLPGHPEEYLEAGRRARTLDDAYSDGWEAEGIALALLGRFDEAGTAFDRCTAVSLSSSSCFTWRFSVDAIPGRCEQAEQDVRAFGDRSRDAANTARSLVPALFALGRPRESLHAVAEQRWNALLEPARARVRVREEIALDVAYGEFAHALARSEESLRLADGSEDLNDHLPALVPLVHAALETGDSKLAADLAYRFVVGVDVWRSGSAIMPLRDSASVFLFRVAHAGGRVSKEQFEAYRKRWLTASVEGDDAPAGASWVHAYAGPAETEAEARDALDALPPDTDLERARYFNVDAQIGKVYLLAGRRDEALRWLERSAAGCLGFRDVLSHTRALLLLGQALEAEGDGARACLAYARVVDRWGNAKPRSVTAEKAKERLRALRCAK